MQIYGITNYVPLVDTIAFGQVVLVLLKPQKSSCWFKK